MINEQDHWPDYPMEDPSSRPHDSRRPSRAASQGGFVEGDIERNGSDMEELLLQQLWAYESRERTTLRALLEARGHCFPAPEHVTDERLVGVLWALIHILAQMRVFIDCTDHLSDRQLYEFLWREALPADDIYLTDDPDWFCHLDPIGSGSAEDTQLYLRYYADEFWRSRWADEFPEDELPDRQRPPYDRDRRLPRPSQFP